MCSRARLLKTSSLSSLSTCELKRAMLPRVVSRRWFSRMLAWQRCSRFRFNVLSKTSLDQLKVRCVIHAAVLQNCAHELSPFMFADYHTPFWWTSTKYCTWNSRFLPIWQTFNTFHSHFLENTQGSGTLGSTLLGVVWLCRLLRQDAGNRREEREECRRSIFFH